VGYSVKSGSSLASSTSPVRTAATPTRHALLMCGWLTCTSMNEDFALADTANHCRPQLACAGATLCFCCGQNDVMTRGQIRRELAACLFLHSDLPVNTMYDRTTYRSDSLSAGGRCSSAVFCPTHTHSGTMRHDQRIMPTVVSSEGPEPYLQTRPWARDSVRAWHPVPGHHEHAMDVDPFLGWSRVLCWVSASSGSRNRLSQLQACCYVRGCSCRERRGEEAWQPEYSGLP
jgi:hypothetical protein